MPPTEVHDHNGLAVLTRSQCLQLLGQAVLGRIGLTVGALPTILPVNFALLGEDVIIRTGWGVKLRAASDQQVVCFEVDGFDPPTRSGWSVLATGRAEAIDDPTRLERVRALRLEPWASERRDHYVVIHTELLSGRRVRPANGLKASTTENVS